MERQEYGERDGDESARKLGDGDESPDVSDGAPRPGLLGYGIGEVFDEEAVDKSGKAKRLGPCHGLTNDFVGGGGGDEDFAVTMAGRTVLVRVLGGSRHTVKRWLGKVERL